MKINPPKLNHGVSADKHTNNIEQNYMICHRCAKMWNSYKFSWQYVWSAIVQFCKGDKSHLFPLFCEILSHFLYNLMKLQLGHH